MCAFVAREVVLLPISGFGDAEVAMYFLRESRHHQPESTESTDLQSETANSLGIASRIARRKTCAKPAGLSVTLSRLRTRIGIHHGATPVDISVTRKALKRPPVPCAAVRSLWCLAV